MKKILIILIAILYSAAGLLAQIKIKEIPHSFNMKNKVLDISSLPLFIMDTFDIEAYRISIKNNKTLRFAKSFDVNIDIKKNGLKEIVDSGVIWRLAVKSAKAFSLNLIFSEFLLEKGTRLHLYNPDKTFILGAYSEKNNPIISESKNTIFAIQPINGDEIIVELFEPFYNTNTLCIIGKINHDVVGFAGGTFGSSCSDQVDVICSEGDNWRKEINSACFLIINGMDACSAALINNTEEDGKALILTANHCYDFDPPQTDEQIAAAVSSTIVVFNYDSPWCNGSVGINTNTVSGAALRAKSRNTDFLLMEANNIIPTSYYPYHAGWNRTSGPFPNGVVIHHPSIDVKKIATHSQQPVNSLCMNTTLPSGVVTLNVNFWGITAYDVTTNGHSRTEPGSSGSPLFDPKKRIIGQLFGPGVCLSSFCTNHEGETNSTTNFGSFGKLSISWDGLGTSSTRLKDWLNPNIIPAPIEFLGLRYIRYHTVNHDAWFTGDVVKFHDVNILTGYDVTVTEIQNRFEATGTFDIPTGVVFNVF